MIIEGQYLFNFSPEQVFDALNDPTVLLDTIPGATSMSEDSPNNYSMTLTAGVASIKGTYQAKVSLEEPNRPLGFILNASGSGAPGTVEARVTVKLAPNENGTLLTYSAQAQVGGVIAGVGQRVLSGVSKKTAQEFFSAVDGHIAGNRPKKVQAAAKNDLSQAPRKQPASSQGIGYLFAGGLLVLAGVLVGWLISR